MPKKHSQFWEKFKARLKERWEDLQDDEIDLCINDFDLLSVKIQQRFHESRDVVQDYVDNLWFEIFVRSARQTYPQEQGSPALF
ncbi:MAG TPA: hypothetical protein VL688_02410 [Verrucomicrobiae bacterium]|nr:hypothetical protein [Verrucomicrobiae bacterium]